MKVCTNNRVPRCPGSMCLALLTMILSLPNEAAERVDYPARPEITHSEWIQLRESVLTHRGVDCASETAMIRRCASDALRTIWWMTEVGHEAHPAMIRQALVRKDGSVVLETSGYFAGDHAAFRRWYTVVLREDQRQLRSIVSKLPSNQ